MYGRIGLSLIALAISGCAPWPPQEKELTEYFYENRANFESLIDAMLVDGLSSITTAQLGNVVTMKQLLEPGIQARYRDLFENVGAITAVSKSGEAFQLHLGTAHLESRTIYSIFYLRGRVGQLEPCARGQDQDESGSCFIPLTGDWSIVYTWDPRAA